MTTDHERDHVEVRRLWPSDGRAVEAHFLRLDAQTRADRFMAAIGEASALSYARRAFRTTGVIYGAFLRGSLRGVGELRPLRRHVLGPCAEAAFVVERGYRRLGLGAGLFGRVLGAARHRGVRELHVRCLADNQPMRRLALRSGAQLRLSGPEADGTVLLNRPTPYSFWREGVTEGFDYLLALSAPSSGAPFDGRT